MIILDKSLIDNLDPQNPSLPAVQAALQQAVQLEHATIPPYLYALYSLIPGKNDAIAAIIQSIVVEEMLHMTLASNILNAIGGAPDIGKPDFIPAYPGHLPGGVQGGLTVHLRPFSMTQLQTFLDIEEPENPLVFKSFALAEQPVTIGMFYNAISECIAALGDEVFVEGPYNQVGPDLMFDSVVVTDVASAQRAIHTIVEQGEGTATSPEAVVGGGFAHYYRFQQIQKGHKLVAHPHGPDPDDQYSFTGAPVPFDQTGVYPIPADPHASRYSGQQAFENDTFNYTYTSLLKALHALFNGANSSESFNRTIGLMMSLKGQIRAIAAGLPNPQPQDVNFVGPSFEYQPVNPGPLVKAA